MDNLVIVQRRSVQDGSGDWVDGCPWRQSLSSRLVHTDWSGARSVKANLLVCWRHIFSVFNFSCSMSYT